MMNNIHEQIAFSHRANSHGDEMSTLMMMKSTSIHLKSTATNTLTEISETGSVCESTSGDKEKEFFRYRDSRQGKVTARITLIDFLWSCYLFNHKSQLATTGSKWIHERLSTVWARAVRVPAAGHVSRRHFARTRSRARARLEQTSRRTFSAAKSETSTTRNSQSTER